MASKLLNIEVGDQITKVCVTAGKKKGARVVDAFTFLTPPNAVQDGQVLDVQGMAECLSTELNRHGSASGLTSAIFTIVSPKVASREVLLPPMKENRIAQMITTNAGDYFPVELSKYRVSHVILQNVQGETPGVRVLALAIPLALLESYTELARYVGLTVEAVDYCGNSQQQLLGAMTGDSITMFVDVGVNATYVNFMQGGVLLLQRTLPMGGDDIIRDVLAAGEMDESSYLDVMDKIRDESYLADFLSDEVRYESIYRLVNGITRSTDFFKSNFRGYEVEQVMISGSCGAISGLAASVQDELGIQTDLLTEVRNPNVACGGLQDVASYIACIGSNIAPLPIVIGEAGALVQKTEKSERKDNSRTLGMLSIGIVAVSAVMAIYAITYYNLKLAEQRSLNKQVEELSYVEQVYNTYTEYKTTDDNLKIVQQPTQAENSRLTKFLAEFEAKMPSNLLVASATCDDMSVTISASTNSFAEAAVAIAQLRSFESLGSLGVSALSQETNEAGTKVNFSVVCTYQSAVEAAAMQAAAEEQANAATEGE